MKKALPVLGSLMLALMVWFADPRPAAQDRSMQKPDVTGVWALNKDLSDEPPALGADRVGAAAGRRGGGGFGGGAGLGGFGGAGGFGGGRSNPEDMQAMQEAVRQVMEAPQRLTITQSENDVTVTDGNGRSQKLATTGKSEKHQLGSRTVDTKTRWDGARLVKEMSLGDGMKVTETYTLAKETQRLQVEVKLEDQRMNRTMRRVYDDVSQQ